MKKIMPLMLGLSLVLGSFAYAADEKPADKTSTTEKKSKKKGEKKSADKKNGRKEVVPSFIRQLLVRCRVTGLAEARARRLAFQRRSFQ